MLPTESHWKESWLASHHATMEKPLPMETIYIIFVVAWNTILTPLTATKQAVCLGFSEVTSWWVFVDKNTCLQIWGFSCFLWLLRHHEGMFSNNWCIYVLVNTMGGKYQGCICSAAFEVGEKKKKEEEKKQTNKKCWTYPWGETMWVTASLCGEINVARVLYSSYTDALLQAQGETKLKYNSVPIIPKTPEPSTLAQWGGIHPDTGASKTGNPP